MITKTQKYKHIKCIHIGYIRLVYQVQNISEAGQFSTSFQLDRLECRPLDRDISYLSGLTYYTVG